MWYAIVGTEDSYEVVFGSGKADVDHPYAIILREVPLECRYLLRKGFVKALRQDFPKLDALAVRAMCVSILLHGWTECVASELGDGRAIDEIDFADVVARLIRYLCNVPISFEGTYQMKDVDPKDSRRILERLRLEGRIARCQMKRRAAIAAA